MARDPVCGMQVDDKKAPHSLHYKGITYHFCSPACKAAFEENAERYTGTAETYMTVGR